MAAALVADALWSLADYYRGRHPSGIISSQICGIAPDAYLFDPTVDIRESVYNAGRSEEAKTNFLLPISMLVQLRVERVRHAA
jgi:hypothetical protein